MVTRKIKKVPADENDLNKIQVILDYLMIDLKPPHITPTSSGIRIANGHVIKLGKLGIATQLLSCITKFFLPLGVQPLNNFGDGNCCEDVENFYLAALLWHSLRTTCVEMNAGK
ncbi:MAG: hypothetical protein OET18_03390 [Desulfobacterales bacterium]|jgi:hypothetical protein|nr:hypothetical protein [Desulfobacterales bacterium]